MVVTLIVTVSSLVIILPAACASAFAVRLSIESFWRVYAQRGSLAASRSSDVRSSLSALIVLVATLAVINALLPAYGYGRSSSVLSMESLVAYALIIALVIFSRETQPSLDAKVLCFMVSAVALVLFRSSNLISIFFALEIMNAAVIYSMLFTNRYDSRDSARHGAGIVGSCVYQLVLNFFSSILLYVGVNSYIAATGSASLELAPLLSGSCATPAAALVAGFFFKLGTGPWIFFKVNIYKSMNSRLAAVYTVAYTAIIFIFFANLFFVYGLELLPAYGYAGMLAAAGSCLLFAGSAFQVPNFFVFLSFSSLLNLSVFVMQVLSAALVFE